MSKCCESNNNNSYDVAVIGAGSAGFSAAITAADEGAQVVLIGHGTIGGTCVNVGCVPSKTLIRAAQSIHAASASARFDGIEVSSKVTDWSAAVKQKQQLVDELRKAKYTDVLPAYKSITYLEGEAAFSAGGDLVVGDQVIDAKNVIIATGSRAALPSIKGIGQVSYLTSTTALEMENLPTSLLIIGAGYVGVEIAQIFSRAGVKVTIVSRRGLLAHTEPEISEALTRYFADEGISILSGITYERIEENQGTIKLYINGTDGPQHVTADEVMIASGRVPNIERLNLVEAGIEISASGGIKVDQQMRTTRQNIYAAGDVTGTDQFVYMAAYGAKIAAKNAISSNSYTMIIRSCRRLYFATRKWPVSDIPNYRPALPVLMLRLRCWAWITYRAPSRRAIHVA